MVYLITVLFLQKLPPNGKPGTGDQLNPTDNIYILLLKLSTLCAIPTPTPPPITLPGEAENAKE